MNMENKSVYRVNIQVTHMKVTQLPDECAGAFVNVYVSANTLRDSLDLAIEVLIEDKYKPVEIISSYQIDEEDFSEEYSSEGDPEKEDLEHVLKFGGYWYSAFYTFPPEETEIQ